MVLMTILEQTTQIAMSAGELWNCCIDLGKQTSKIGTFLKDYNNDSIIAICGKFRTFSTTVISDLLL